MMRCSVVMATYNKAALLERCLDSIFRQQTEFEYEVIVVDDGSNDATQQVCNQWPLRYCYLHRPFLANPAVPRNVGYRMARGQVVICQSDEVVHVTDDAVEQLVTRLQPGTFRLATVYEVDSAGLPQRLLCGPRRRQAMFFLGSLWRRDLCAVGGNDEEFNELGSEDLWFTDCLLYGRKLSSVYCEDVIGHHHTHPRPPLDELRRTYARMRRLHRRKRSLAAQGAIPYCAAGGPWPFSDNSDDPPENRGPTASVNA